MNLFLFLFSLLSLARADLIQVDARAHLGQLLKQEDCDKDRKITVDDGACGSRKYVLTSTTGVAYQVKGTYQLANLVQELKLAEGHGKLDTDRVLENPVERISRNIRELYWDGLTRRIDADHLEQVLPDPKLGAQSTRYLYVPAGDERGFRSFTGAVKEKKLPRVQVVKLPKEVSSVFVNELGEKHGLLSLALREEKDGKLRGVPFVVPGGRFNEMYGWDSYFEALGLLEDGKVDLAKSMVDNFVYEITHYGKILNANRTYYLTRSQPPFLTSMIRAVHRALPESREKLPWLRTSLRAAIREYEEVWMGKDRLTPLGLSRYAGFSEGIPPEVEPGHFDETVRPFARKHNLSLEKFLAKFTSGELPEPELTEFFLHDRAVRESGHDTTYRWRVDGKDRCADFVTVDLNALLYKYEIDLAALLKTHFNGNLDGHTSRSFSEKASKRKALIRRYLWDARRGLFFDYDWVRKKPSSYLSATTLYPLWAMDPEDPQTRILERREAGLLVKAALAALEQKGGLSATDAASLEKFGDRTHERQWEFPNGWAPHQMLAWQGLSNYGFRDEAGRLVYKWLFMITRNAMNYNGTIPEKYDVVQRSHKVFAEYGNVGTEFSYITLEGFGWMNASYQVGLGLLEEKKLVRLKRMEEHE